MPTLLANDLNNAICNAAGDVEIAINELQFAAVKVEDVALRAATLTGIRQVIAMIGRLQQKIAKA